MLEYYLGTNGTDFDGGTLRAEKRAAVDAMRASAANYEQTVLEAFCTSCRPARGLDHDAEQLDAQAKAQQAAQSSLDLARLSYQEGNAGVLLVLDAERSYQQARLGYVRAVVQRYPRYRATLPGTGRHESECACGGRIESTRRLRAVSRRLHPVWDCLTVTSND